MNELFPVEGYALRLGGAVLDMLDAGFNIETIGDLLDMPDEQFDELTDDELEEMI
jgi:hypothetical protein